MPEYEETQTVNAAPDVVFDYVSDVDHLPEYIPHMVLAHATGDRLRVAADVQGRHEEGDAWFRADHDHRRIEWGADDSGRYQGWLQVSGSGQGSLVTIHLSTERDEDAQQIRDALSEALHNITSRVARA
jgi:Polyketide cyclase / dehydrase and lipid transport